MDKETRTAAYLWKVLCMDLHYALEPLTTPQTTRDPGASS
jgi:hypothetical protein